MLDKRKNHGKDSIFYVAVYQTKHVVVLELQLYLAHTNGIDLLS